MFGFYFPLCLQLALKTVNSSRSAFSCFVFAPAFFLNYDDGRAIVEQGQGDGNEEEVVKCKIGMKVLLLIINKTMCSVKSFMHEELKVA